MNKFLTSDELAEMVPLTATVLEGDIRKVCMTRTDLLKLCNDAVVSRYPKDHIIAQVVNNLRDVAVKFHDTQQLRSRIQDAIAPLLEKPDES